jgi:hypothetical protein
MTVTSSGSRRAPWHWIVLGVAASAILSCGPGRTYVVSELIVDRVGWDTVSVDVSFLRADGRPAVVSPAISVTAFASDFDTLYAGSSTRIPIPDERLYGSEPLLVEVCGRFPDGQVCEQRGLLASPKRILVEEEISYPEDGDFDRVAYELGFVVERQRFGDQSGERIRKGSAVTSYLMTYVGDAPTTGELRIPVRGRRARFNLARLANYRDFSYHLRSSLMERSEATVRFDIYASIGGESHLVASADRVLRSKSRRVREMESGDFAEEAMVALLDHLHAFGARSRPYVYMKSWDYDDSERRYRIELDVLWRKSFLGSRWYELRGVLEVGEDGRDAVFRAVEGNRRARSEWLDRVDGTSLRLGDLSAGTTAADVGRTVASNPVQSN